MFSPDQPLPGSSKMARTFFKLAGPNVVTNVLGFLCNVTLVVFAGRMGDPIYVAVVGLTSTCCAVMAKSLMIGLNCA